MSSIIEGYNYDIFISYRQKDNKHDGWVTEFVNNLKGELESTFKEEISVYFDINPHDGLLETHDVDASLKEKLKCLIFIPIISRTYCDPKSFAWEHEFKAFVEMASKDQFGLKVKLPNGNVASRVLPIQIHDLDPEDKKCIEEELCGRIRGIEFIYKEAGVDRPLTNKDTEEKNLNRTNYRNQINKVALAIRDILSGFKQPQPDSEKPAGEVPVPDVIPAKKSRIKMFAGISLLLVLVLAGFLFVPKLISPEKQTVKSIAVLPFVNMSNDPQQEYFCGGIMQEIMNNLYMISGLDIPPSTSSMRYKDSKLTVKKIARALNVNYLLEGFVSRSGNHVRIIVRLIDGKTEKIRWSQSYDFDITSTDLINLQSDVAQNVAKNMNVVLQSSINERFSYISTKNTEAYDLYLQAKKLGYTPAGKILIEKAIEIDPSFSDAYAELAFYYIWGGARNLKADYVIARAQPLIEIALELNKNCVKAHQALTAFNLLYTWDFKAVEREREIIRELSPSNPENLGYDYLLAAGKCGEALSVLKELEPRFKDEYIYWMQMALAYSFNNQAENACNSLEKAWKCVQGYNSLLHIMTLRIYDHIGKYREAIESYDKYYPKENSIFNLPCYYGYVGVAAYKAGERTRSDTCLKKLLIRSEVSSIGSPSFYAAAIYTSMGETDKAVAMVEKAFTNREIEMYWIKSEPLFRPLHGNAGYERIISKMGFD